MKKYIIAILVCVLVASFGAAKGFAEDKLLVSIEYHPEIGGGNHADKLCLVESGAVVASFPMAIAGDMIKMGNEVFILTGNRILKLGPQGSLIEYCDLGGIFPFSRMFHLKGTESILMVHISSASSYFTGITVLHKEEDGRLYLLNKYVDIVPHRTFSAAVDSENNLYLLNDMQHTGSMGWEILKVTPDGETTVIGSEICDESLGDMIINSVGDIYLNTRHAGDTTLWRIPDGGVREIVPVGPDISYMDNFTIDSSDNIFMTTDATTIKKIDPSGQITEIMTVDGYIRSLLALE